MLRVLRRREFGLYFTGGSLSSLGTWCHNIAAGLVVYELTGSTFVVGLVNFSQFIGSVLLAPVAGAAADRWDRRRILVAAQLAAAAIGAVLAVIVIAGLVTAPIVILATLLMGLAMAFAVPSLMALVPLLVDEEDLDTAVALNSVMFNLARAIGPVLGAAVVEWAGYGTAFALNSASFVAFISMLLVIRPRAQQRHDKGHTRFIDSLRHVRASRRLVALLLAVMAVSMSTDPVQTLPPELVRDVFEQRDLFVGFLVGSFGAGAVITAFLVVPRLQGRRRVLFWAMVVQGCGMVLVGIAPMIEIAMLGMFISGAGFMSAITRSTARLHAEVDDAQRGRIMAMWSLAFLGSRPLASLVDGLVAELAGARSAAVVLALPVLLTAVVVNRLLPPITLTSGDEDTPGQPDVSSATGSGPGSAGDSADDDALDPRVAGDPGPRDPRLRQRAKRRRRGDPSI